MGKISFELSEEESEKSRKWIKKQKKKHGENTGTMGDRFSYIFTPTGLGDIVYILDGMTGEKELLTDFNNF